MVDYGLKITKSGDDIATALDKDLVYSTKYSTLKLYTWGDTTVTTDGNGDGTRTIAHNLGFEPAFFTFNKATAGYTFLDASTYANSYMPIGSPNIWSTSNLLHAHHAATDDTNFYIKVDGGPASTTFNYRYYILTDQAQDFSGAGGATTSVDYGLKISKPGFDVKTAKEYQMAYSSKYKALQFYDANFKEYDLTLPAMWTSPIDEDVEEGTYVDIYHGLGYPPFFLAYFSTDRLGNGVLYETPYYLLSGIDVIDYNVCGFCDATRVRLSFWRLANWFAGSSIPTWNEETISLKVYIFTEDLSG